MVVSILICGSMMGLEHLPREMDDSNDEEGTECWNENQDKPCLGFCIT